MYSKYHNCDIIIFHRHHRKKVHGERRVVVLFDVVTTSIAGLARVMQISFLQMVRRERRLLKRVQAVQTEGLLDRMCAPDTPYGGSKMSPDLTGGACALVRVQVKKAQIACLLLGL